MRRLLRWGVLVAVLATGPAALAATSASSGYWSTGTTWGGSVPGIGEDVLIQAGHTVTADVATASLSSLTNNGTLVFDGWTNILTATNVTINGNVTHTPITDVAGPPWDPDRRIYIVCTNLTVSGSINADGKGYQGATSGTYTPGRGPGGGGDAAYGPPGAGHGGKGGNSKLYGGNGKPIGGGAYDSVTDPADAGSSPGQNQGTAAVNGGGIIRIEAWGQIVVNGTITAHGQTGVGSQAGAAGGSIYIRANTIQGSGQIRAQGGSAGNGYTVIGAGGGGCISINFDTNAQAALGSQPTLQISAAGGLNSNYLDSTWGAAGGVPYEAALTNSWRWGSGEPGPIYLTGTNFWPSTSPLGGRIVCPIFTNWSVPSLSLTNGLVILPPGMTLTVAGAITATGSGGLEMSNSVLTVGGNLNLNTATYGQSAFRGGPLARYTVAGNLAIDKGWLELQGIGADITALNVGGDLTLTGGGALYAYSGDTTNAGAVAPGLLVSVTGALSTAGNSWIYPHTSWTNGGSVLFRANSVTLGAGGGINANAKGYAGGLSNYGTGFGSGASAGAAYGVGGAGYGGHAGEGVDYTGYSVGGSAYGNAIGPIQPGSGSGRYQNISSSFGGGLVRMEVTNAVTINGSVLANGETDTAPNGGGSGGGIWITAETFSGDGLLSVCGGNASGNGGGAGGGRILLAYSTSLQGSVFPQPTFRLAAAGGVNLNTGLTDAKARASRGNSGTVWVTDTAFFPVNALQGGRIVIPGFTNWVVPGGLTVTNGMAGFPGGFALTVSNDITLHGTGGIEITNSALTVLGNLIMDSGASNTAGSTLYGGPSSSVSIAGNVLLRRGWLEIRGGESDANDFLIGGNIVITNDADLYVFSGRTNGEASAYGVRVSVGGDIDIATNSWLYPYSHSTNGGSPMFVVRNLTIQTPNSGINADTKGFRGGVGSYQPGLGPGASLAAAYAVGGAGYGGVGGKGNNAGNGESLGGPTYGSSNAPVAPGSGAGQYQGTPGGYGGGLVRVDAVGTIQVDGSITANGGAYPTAGSGSSGGAIYLSSKRFKGTGVVQALGGNAVGGTMGAGGGGRIAIWRIYDAWSGTAIEYPTSVAGGTGSSNGLPGTVFFGQLRDKGTIFVVR